MEIDKATRMSILYDYYGQLLTEKQHDIVGLYHGDNLSLSEIGAELDISKQGIHDALKKAENLLEFYENKLGLVRENQENEKIIDEIREIIKKIWTNKNIDTGIKKDVGRIKKNIDKISR